MKVELSVWSQSLDCLCLDPLSPGALRVPRSARCRGSENRGSFHAARRARGRRWLSTTRRGGALSGATPRVPASSACSVEPSIPHSTVSIERLCQREMSLPCLVSPLVSPKGARVGRVVDVLADVEMHLLDREQQSAARDAVHVPLKHCIPVAAVRCNFKKKSNARLARALTQTPRVTLATRERRERGGKRIVPRARGCETRLACAPRPQSVRRAPKINISAERRKGISRGKKKSAARRESRAIGPGALARDPARVLERVRGAQPPWK